MFIFPVQLTTSRIGNLTRLIHTLLYVMTIHTYIQTVTKSVVSCTKCRILCTSISFRLFPALCCWRKGVVAGFLPVYRQYIVALGYTLCFSNTANSEGRTGVCSPFGPRLGSPPKNASKYVWKSPTKSVWEDVCFQRLGSLGGVQSHTPQCTGTGAAE